MSAHIISTIAWNWNMDRRCYGFKFTPFGIESLLHIFIFKVKFFFPYLVYQGLRYRFKSRGQFDHLHTSNGGPVDTIGPNFYVDFDFTALEMLLETKVWGCIIFLKCSVLLKWNESFCWVRLEAGNPNWIEFKAVCSDAS